MHWVNKLRILIIQRSNFVFNPPASLSINFNISFSRWRILYHKHACMGGSRGDAGVRPPPPPPPPLKKHKKYRASKQYWSRFPEKSQSYQASIQCWAIIGTPAKRLLMAFPWRADDGPILVVFGSSLPHQLKKTLVKCGPPLTKLSGSAYGMHSHTVGLKFYIFFLSKMPFTSILYV